jgi:hypothetical protein
MKVLWVVCFVLFAACVVNAQEPDEAQEAEPLVQRNIERSGWTIPLFADQVSEVKDGKPEIIEGVEVQTKLHKLKDEQLVYVESCDPKVDEKLIANGQRRDFVVRGFTTYEVKGRVFAYGVVYYIVMAENGYITERYGAAVNVHYVDEDGNGTFELRCRAMTLKSLPEWVKSLAAK